MGFFDTDDISSSSDVCPLPPASERGSSSGEGSHQADQEVLAGSPIGRT